MFIFRSKYGMVNKAQAAPARRSKFLQTSSLDQKLNFFQIIQPYLILCIFIPIEKLFLHDCYGFRLSFPSNGKINYKKSLDISSDAWTVEHNSVAFPYQ